jgi:hypothetical protein
MSTPKLCENCDIALTEANTNHDDSICDDCYEADELEFEDKDDEE